MLKKIIVLFFCYIAAFYVKLCFADTPMTKWKCAVYPAINSPNAKNYVIIEYNQDKAIKYIYYKSPFSSEFSLFKFHYKYVGRQENNPDAFVYLYADNSAILVIDTVKHRAAEGITYINIMPPSINDKEDIMFNKKHKWPAYQRTGAEGRGYYCNINQNIKLPAWKGEITDNYDNI